MNKTISFIILGIFLASFSFLFVGCQNKQTDIISYKITPSLAQELITEDNKVVLLDIRKTDEYKSRHLANSINIPLENLREGIRNHDNISKEDDIIIYCNSGVRSYDAYEILSSLGYEKAKSMSGGILEWISLGYKTCSGTQFTC